MAVSFSTQDKFNRNKAFRRVIFGWDAKLLETELNEMQKIFAEQFNVLTKSIASNGFVNVPALTLAGGSLTLPIDAFVLNGIVFEMIESMSISVANGDKVYLAVWEQNVTYQDSIKTGGNLSGGSNIADNGIFDSRPEINEETTRRVQLQMQLVKSNADVTKQYLPVATITGASTFTDNRTRPELSIGIKPNAIDTAQLKDGAVSDAKIGNRTPVDTTAPAAGAQSITNLFSMLTYMTKAITGKSDWRTAPVASLESMNTSKASLSGAVFTGPVTLNADPTAALHATTKQWVEAQVALARKYAP